MNKKDPFPMKKGEPKPAGKLAGKGHERKEKKEEKKK